MPTYRMTTARIFPLGNIKAANFSNVGEVGAPQGLDNSSDGRDTPAPLVAATPIQRALTRNTYMPGSNVVLIGDCGPFTISTQFAPTCFSTKYSTVPAGLFPLNVKMAGRAVWANELPAKASKSINNTVSFFIMLLKR